MAGRVPARLLKQGLDAASGSALPARMAVRGLRAHPDDFS
jgi:hypothetical protein